MEYQCLLSFSNKLKPDSAEVIKRLSLGAVNCRVISGDNLTTTIATSRLAGIIEGDD
jgi:magnesium-transporting ATPase (P-type)